MGATFKIIEKGTTTLSDVRFSPSTSTFREYKIVGGQKVMTPGTFIQRRSKRLSARSEIGEIQIAKRRTPKKISGGGFNGRYY